jgi:DNA-binding HxlR family transcriptional regulator
MEKEAVMRKVQEYQLGGCDLSLGEAALPDGTKCGIGATLAVVGGKREASILWYLTRLYLQDLERLRRG